MRDLLRLLRLFDGYRRLLAAGVALSVVVILANVALLALSGWFITAMALAGLGVGTINYFTPAAGIRALAIIRTFGRYGERLVTHEATLRVLARLRVWFYEHLEPLAPARLQFYRGGDLLSRIRADIDTLDHFYLRVLAPGIAAAVTVALLAGFLSLFSAPIALINIAGLLLAGVGLPLWMQRLGVRPGARVVNRRSDLRAAVADGARGLGELKVYQAVDRQAERIEQLSEQLTAPQRQQARIDGLASALGGLATHLSLWLVLVIAIPLVTATRLEAPQLAMIVFFVLASFEAVAPLPVAFQSLGETIAAARRIFEIVDSEPAVADPPYEAERPASFGLRLDRVSMRYDVANAWALANVDLQVAAGERVAVVGATGSGKSSLFNVLLRFWPYQHGQIEIGGQPLDSFCGETMRRWCAVITQQTRLFNTTIRANLRLAWPEADDTALYAALDQAYVGQEIRALPHGLDTIVGETGTRLSGGQARRVAIARAFLKDAPILLLDEPTEGLDAVSERAVLQALETLMAGRTTLIITHRPQTLAYIDHVVVLAGGRVLEQGAPADLMRTGRYLPIYSAIG
ncbi:thiol reductant ABC exporter subunit CydC [Salinisphaera sp. USBA-960]|uniref:thiol reductant ABC exporter subunit CydC n=1 Tax=Salinisphaera orenii TaxID=856731 RepID=UPI000DBE777E|nr:thiol reductant ABC exporter subunit CydC [Salifodinibacter halophilus]NNC25943.1 thiol reductant ABC exporter subunit CydC [Salifodinibacter halophilus]